MGCIIRDGRCRARHRASRTTWPIPRNPFERIGACLLSAPSRVDNNMIFLADSAQLFFICDFAWLDYAGSECIAALRFFVIPYDAIWPRARSSNRGQVDIEMVRPQFFLNCGPTAIVVRTNGTWLSYLLAAAQFPVYRAPKTM